jgi:RNA polymerase sigma factor (sigma-70 family)
LLRLQSDDRLVALTRRGNQAAFEVLVSRYQSRLLAFCRHLLGSREDAEDVLQEVFAAAFNALLADERPINVRPWLYRIARNRSLNHLRKVQAVGVDSMDIHFSEHGATTADKVQDREQFRLLMDDIQGLPETQRSALILREMDALSYEQIAEAMDTTVPGIKSLLVRARISLAEAAEARQLSCSEVRLHLGEIAEGLRRRPEPVVRRHLRSCQRCSSFQGQLKSTNKALAVLLPLGPLALLRRLIVAHLGHSASSGSAGVGATASGSSAAAAGSAGSAGIFSAGAGAVATKAAAGIAAAMVVTGGAVEVTHVVAHHPAATHHRVLASAPAAPHVHRSVPAVVVPSELPTPPVAKHVQHKQAKKLKADAKTTAATAVPAAKQKKPTVTATSKHPAGSTTATTPTVSHPATTAPTQTHTTTPAASTPPAGSTGTGHSSTHRHRGSGGSHKHRKSSSSNTSPA